jgi:hypothetical protein
MDGKNTITSSSATINTAASLSTPMASLQSNSHSNPTVQGHSYTDTQYHPYTPHNIPRTGVNVSLSDNSSGMSQSSTLGQRSADLIADILQQQQQQHDADINTHSMHTLRPVMPASASSQALVTTPLHPPSSSPSSSVSSSPGLSAHTHSSLAALQSSTSHLLATFNGAGLGSSGNALVPLSGSASSVLTPAKAKVSQMEGSALTLHQSSACSYFILSM